MKTALPTPDATTGFVESTKEEPATSPLRVVHKSDLHNHRFAVLENKTVEESRNWDTAWFASYE